MKKYIQISVFLGIFFLLVIVKNLRGSDDAAPVVGQANTTVNSNSTNLQSSANYKDGTYTGSSEDAYYGNIQVQVTISSGKISDVQFLQYPNDNQTSSMINGQAMPMLKQEALQTQSANVDIVSGASDSSVAFQKSLSNALQQAG